jgi:hypothetical protein
MHPGTNKVIVFYAWQSDLPDSTNRRAIRGALYRAAAKLGEKYAERKLRIEIDEATRGEAGSPNIPLSILRKIEQSDVFVCDVTPINSLGKSEEKPTPNPNVIFELGYALAHLGWPRVIMLFNEAFGRFPDDLPFDLDRHRASRYKLKPVEHGKAGDYSSLDAVVATAVGTVLENNPPRPSEGIALDPPTLRRQRDVRNLRWALEAIHWPTLQKHIEEGPHLVRSKVFHFWEEFNSVVRNHLFYLHDGAVRRRLLKVHQLWGYSLSFGEHYVDTKSGNFIFQNPGDMPLSSIQLKDWKAIEKTLRDLNKAVSSLLTFVRKQYMEIDLEETNKVAWLEFLRDEESFAAAFARTGQEDAV